MLVNANNKELCCIDRLFSSILKEITISVIVSTYFACKNITLLVCLILVMFFRSGLVLFYLFIIILIFTVTHTEGEVTVDFHWKRVRLFDQLACQVLYDICMERPTATVEKVQTKPKSKWRPLPLDTVVSLLMKLVILIYLLV